MRLFGKLTLALLLACVTLVATAQDLNEPVQLRIATQDAGSSWYAYGGTISELLRQNLPAGSVVDVLPYTGSIGNTQIVAQGQAELGMNFAPIAKWGHEGTSVYEQPMENLRAIVGGLDQYYFGMIAREGYKYDSLKEIVEAQAPVRIITQPRGGTGETAAALLLEAYGVTYEDVESWGGSVTHTSTDTVVSAMKDGRADVWFQPMPAGHPAVTELATTAQVKFLEPEEETLEFMAENYGMFDAVLPAGTFRGQDEDVRMLGFPTVIMTTTDLPDEVAYAVAKILAENADVLADRHASMRVFDPQEAFKVENTGLPLHPGVQQYVDEAGLPSAD